MSNPLIEKAKLVPGRGRHRLTDDQIELAVAWARGEISGIAVATAMNMGVGPGGHYSSKLYLFLCYALREYVRRNGKEA